jgi:hypothetical protein
MTPARSPYDPGAPALAALADKYRALALLRRAKARGEPPPNKAFFRTLAARFPGALRELDTVPLADLDDRADALERAARDPAAFQPWMGWLHGYHAWMRAALALKPRLAALALDADLAARLAGEISNRTGLAVDPAFVHAVAAPPGGRVRTVVLACVAREYGAPLDALHATLLPRMVVSCQ